MVPRRSLPWFAAMAVLVAAPPARAQEEEQDFPDIVDRAYVLDLHQGAVLGSGRTVGMGGTAVATAGGSAGALFNPASPAIRPENSNDTWDWDWHFDALTTSVGTDFDNNRLEVQEEDRGLLEAPLLTAGLVGQYRSWGVSVSGLFFQHPIDQEGPVDLTAQTLVARIAVARSFLADEITVGVGFRSGTFSMQQVAPDPERGEVATQLFSIAGSSLEAGAVWRPPGRDLRVGLSGSLPVTSDQVEVQDCDPLDCTGEAEGEGYILPERAALPWQVSVGAAWRRAATRWNRKIRTDWRDEKYLLVAADLVVTGHVPGGQGLEAFARRELQPSGRNVGVSPRAGVEYEWVPGRLRIRGGTYWEPSRFRDDRGEAIAGRLHATAGVDVRVWSFCFWSDRYRLRLSLTTDGARHYGNGGLSIGLWH